MIKIAALTTLLLTSITFSAEEEATPWEDLKTTVGYMYQGSYLQFTQKSNLYYAGAGGGALWYSFKNDNRISNKARRQQIHNFVNHIGDAGVIFNFPFAAAGAYYWGRSQKNNHLMQFIKEYMATMYLAIMESGFMSYIYIHKRPDPNHISFWEEAFRDKSSFPSGHNIPYAALFFKTLQFYGPYWSIIPLGFTIAASLQRVQDGKHYLSDVVGSFFMSAVASEGVRAAGKYEKNHPFYKWVFEHDVHLGLLRYQRALGPIVAWRF